MSSKFDSAAIVSQWLTDHNIPHTREQRFEGLKGDYDYLRFDIYIDLETLKICIEVDGQQHYRACCNDNIEAFLKKRNYGRRKEWFCHEHGIFLMRIVYDELPYLDQILNWILVLKDASYLA